MGKPVLYHKDCDELSELILKQTHNRLSPSTLKRFFGIIKSESNPSKFTIRTLNEWVNQQQDHSNSFSSTFINENELDYSTYAEENSQIAVDITQSRITEKAWVSRDTEIKYLSEFLESSQCIHPIIAPPGWGKTIFMLQAWEHVNNTYTDYIKWFFTGSLLRTNKQFLSNQSELFEFLRNRYKTSHINQPVLVFIDALDELSPILTEIKDFISLMMASLSHYLKNGKVKIIISMRVNIWPLLKHEIHSFAPYILYQKHIYDYRGQEYGIRTFSTRDINKWLTYHHLPSLSELKQRVHLTDQQQLDLHIPGVLNQLKWYHDVGIEITPVTHFRSGSLRHLIESHPVSSSIIVVINEFFRLTKFGLETSSLPVRSFINIIKKHYDGYQLLLKENIFKEEITLNKNKLPLRVVRFMHQSYESYFIALELFERYKPLNERFTSWFYGRYSDQTNFEEILSFLIDLSIDDESYSFVELVYSIVLKNRITYGLPLPVNHIFYQLGYTIRISQELRNSIKKFITETETGHSYFIELFVDLDSLMSYYGDFLKISSHHISNKNGGKEFTHTLLLFRGLQELNEPVINSELQEVLSLSKSKSHPYPRARALGIRALIYSYQNQPLSKMLLHEINYLFSDLTTHSQFNASPYVSAALLLEHVFLSPLLSQVLNIFHELYSNHELKEFNHSGSTDFFIRYFFWLAELAKSLSNPSPKKISTTLSETQVFIQEVSTIHYPYQKWTLQKVYTTCMKWAFLSGLLNESEEFALKAIQLSTELGFILDSYQLNFSLAEIRFTMGKISFDGFLFEKAKVEQFLKKLRFKPLLLSDKLNQQTAKSLIA